MKRMNFPDRKKLRREQAIARNAKTLPENRKQARLARGRYTTEGGNRDERLRTTD